MLNKKSKDFIDSLKCPICRSKIDLHDWNSPTDRSINADTFNFVCMLEATHYQIWFKYWNHATGIDDDKVMLKCEDKNYHISQEYDNNNSYIDVLTAKTSKVYYFPYILFDWQKETDLEKIINKVKTLLTFQ